MAHLVPHARRYNTSEIAQNSSARPSSSYNPAPPQAPPLVPQRPTSAYVPPPVYNTASSYSSSSTPTSRPYSQPPIEQFGGLSLNSDASRYSQDYRQNARSRSGNGGPSSGGWGGPQQAQQPQHMDGSGYAYSERPGTASVSLGLVAALSHTTRPETRVDRRSWERGYLAGAACLTSLHPR